MNQKGNTVLYVLLGLLLLILIGGGVYYLGKQNSQPHSLHLLPPSPAPLYQNSSPTIDQTANWKTYQGNGFTLKYPNDWEPSGSDVYVNFFEIGQSHVYPGELHGGNMLMGVQVELNSSTAQLTWKNLHDKTQYPSIQELTVAGKPAIIIGKEADADIHILFGSSNDKLLTIGISDSRRNQILSTLTFIDQNQAGNSIFPVPELGIKFTINNQLNDLVYKTITEPSGIKIIGVAFSTKSLIRADTQQPSGWITNSPYCGAENDPLGDIIKEDQPQRGTPIKINNFYIYYEKPQSPCSKNIDVQNIQSNQQKQVEQAFQAAQPL